MQMVDHTDLPCNLNLQFHLQFSASRHDLRQPLTPGRNRADRGADRAAPDHAPRPTLLEFPALRFIQKRHDVNRRRLQLRHLLLLLLRAAAIALLAFALARPSVKLAGAVGSQEAPVAAALVFDAAPRMEYRHENQTRLEAARDLGLWLLAQLPEQSEIAVIDTRLGSRPRFRPIAARPRTASPGWKRWPTRSRCRPPSTRP